MELNLNILLEARIIRFLIICLFCISPILVEQIKAEEEATSEIIKEQQMSVFLISAKTGNDGASGTGFACKYKGNNYIATNLHVVDGFDSLSVIPQSGDKIPLSGKIIVAEDADICLLGVNIKFEDIDIVPLQFMDDVFAGSKAGDKIICLGNSLGGGVITTTHGTIKAYGQPRLEIESPVVEGNSGGPIIHLESGTVVGLVTEAIINEVKLDKLNEAAKKSVDSELAEVSYFGHRLDSVKKWKSYTFTDFQKTGKQIKNAELGLTRTLQFFTDEDGWREDSRLSNAWDKYQKFIDSSDKVNTKRTETTKYVNEFGVVMRRNSQIKGFSVSEADHEKARQLFRREIEWKILAEQKILIDLAPAGYLQIHERDMLIEISKKLLILHKDL